jgi:hypothetical protein
MQMIARKSVVIHSKDSPPGVEPVQLSSGEPSNECPAVCDQNSSMAILYVHV